MNNLACVKGILKGSTALSDSELEKIVKDFRAKARASAKAAGGTQASAAAQAVAERQATRLRMEAAIQKRNAAENAIKQRALMDQRANYKSISEWAEAMASPSNVDTVGARDSATAKQEGYIGKYLGGFLNDMEKAGLVDYVATRLRDLVDPSKWGKGPLDDKIAIELWEISAEGGKSGRTGSPEAKKIADIVYKYQELARTEANRLGAFIGKIPGYIVAQTHDMDRIVREGFDSWRAQAERTFGNERTYENLKLTGDTAKDQAIITEFWRQGYNQLSQGEHFRVGDESGFKGPGNLAKRVSQHRSYHPNSAELWIEYNDRFGSASLMEAVTGGLTRLGKANGLMEKFGTNPRAQFMNMIEAARDFDLRAGKPIDKRVREGGWTSRLWDVVDGTADIPARLSVAKFGSVARAYESVTKLGAATLSSLPDTVLSAAQIRDDFGENLFSNLGENIGLRLRQFTDKGQQREAAQLMHVGIDTIMRDVSSRITAADATNWKWVHKYTNAFFKLNILSLFTDSGERANSAMMSVRLAGFQDTPHAKLPDELKNIMGRYNIGEKEWDIIRKHARYDHNGTPMLVGDQLRDMPLEAIDPLVEWPLEAIKLEAERGLERLQKRAGQIDAKVEKLSGAMSAQGELGQTVADLKAYSAFLKELQARDFQTLQTGFEKPFDKAASAIAKFTKRDLDTMAQHSRKIDALQTKLKAAKDAEPGTLVDIAAASDAMTEARASLSDAVDALMSGTGEDITKAGKLKARADRLQERIGKLSAGLEKQGRYAEGVADLKALSEYVTTLQDADFRSLVEKQRGKVVGAVARGVARFAKEDERIAAQHRAKIKATQDRLKSSKKAEPAVLDALDKAMSSLDEMQQAIADWPANLEKQQNRRRELAIQELESKFHTYYLNRVHAGVIRGTAREKAYATQGLQAGTPAGEAMRLISQFKQYPMSFVQQILGRYAQEDRFWSIPGALGRRIIADPTGTGVKVANLVLTLTAMGYMSTVLKDLAKGRTPRDPTDPRTWAAAFVQGGGAGLYGDYLFSRVNRFGGTLGEAAAGPFIGSAFDAGDLLLQSREGLLSDLFGEGDEAYPDNRAFNFFKNNTPFLNLFYTRVALDYLILYDAQEWLRPGSLRRMERRLQTDQKQEFMLPPSENRVRPFT